MCRGVPFTLYGVKPQNVIQMLNPTNNAIFAQSRLGMARFEVINDLGDLIDIFPCSLHILALTNGIRKIIFILIIVICCNILQNIDNFRI